eukprot:4324169-Amphidinium_carterae.2
MASHGEHFRNLTAEKQAELDRQARVARMHAETHMLQDMVGKIQSQMAEVRGLVSQRMIAQGMSLAACRFTASHVLAMEDKDKEMKAERGSQVRVREKLEAFMTSPQPLSVSEFERLQSAAQGSLQDYVPLRGFWTQVCNHREKFKDAIFVVMGSSDTSFYRFLFAVKRPFALQFLAIRPVITEQANAPMNIFNMILHDLEAWRRISRKSFSYMHGDVIDAVTCLQDVTLESVFVHLSSSFLGSAMIETTSEAMCLEPLLASLQEQ